MNGPVSGPLSLQLAHGFVRRYDPTVLHRQCLEALAMKVRRVGGHGICDDRGLEALMKGAPSRVLDANLRDRAGNEDRIDAMCDEHIGEPRAMKSVVTVLVDLALSLPRRQLIDDGHAIALALDIAVGAHEARPAAAHRRRDDR